MTDVYIRAEMPEGQGKPEEGYFWGHDAETGKPIQIPLSALPDTPIHVPLTVYVGDNKKIVGDAVIEGNMVEAHIDNELGKELAHFVETGIIQSVSVAFNAPPAIPLLRDGTIRWVKNY